MVGAEVDDNCSVTTERNDVTERLNQVYATESSALDPALLVLAMKVLTEAEKPGLMPLEDYAELYDNSLDAEA